MIKGRVESPGTAGDTTHWFLDFWFFIFSNSITKHLTAFYVAVTEFIIDHINHRNLLGKNTLPLIFSIFDATLKHT